MSDPVVSDAPVPEVVEAPKREHWKVRQKREREEAAKAAVVHAPDPSPAVEQAAPAAPAPAPKEDGFLTWGDFCARVSVDLVNSQYGFAMLTNHSGAEAAHVFFARMEKAYTAVKDAYKRGMAAGL